MEAPEQIPENDRWEAEARFRDREVAVKEKEASVKFEEQRLKVREFKLKKIELRRSRFANPLVLAIIGATLTGITTVIGTGITGWLQINLEEKRSIAQQEIERFKADSNLILEVIKTNNDTQKARTNLTFLVEAGLINDKDRRSEIAKYLKGPGQVPSLPSTTSADDSQKSYGVICKAPLDTDLPKLVNEVENSFNNSNQLSNISKITEDNRTTISAEIQLPEVYRVFLAVKPKLIASMYKDDKLTTISFKIDSSGMGKDLSSIINYALKKFSQDGRKNNVQGKLDDILGSGKVVCDG